MAKKKQPKFKDSEVGYSVVVTRKDGSRFWTCSGSEQGSAWFFTCRRQDAVKVRDGWVKEMGFSRRRCRVVKVRCTQEEL